MCCMCSFELLIDGRKYRLKRVERLTGINKVRNVAFYWLYSVNIKLKLNSVALVRERTIPTEYSRGNYWGSLSGVGSNTSATDHVFCIRQILEKEKKCE